MSIVILIAWILKGGLGVFGRVRMRAKRDSTINQLSKLPNLRFVVITLLPNWMHHPKVYAFCHVLLA